VNTGDVLSTFFEDVAPLNRPIMVVALRGWFDIAEVATSAIDELLAIASHRSSRPSIPTRSSTSRRSVPFVELDDDETRHIVWPANDFQFARFPGSPHDLVVLIGVEPHLRYATFAECVLQVAEASKCEVVVTVGAVADTVPHTRAPLVVGSTTNGALQRALGLSTPRYQGSPVWSACCKSDSTGRHAGRVAARRCAPLPRQRASSAVVDRVAATPPSRPRSAGAHRSSGRRRSSAVACCTTRPWPRTSRPLPTSRCLEREYDQKAEAAIPSGDDLAADFERFLRDQRDDEG
jgi:hypothetical protein